MSFGGSSYKNHKSGRRDLNPGLLAPKASALAGLRYAPILDWDATIYCYIPFKRCEYNVKDEYPSSNKRSNPVDKRSNPADKTDHNPLDAPRVHHRLFAVKPALSYADTRPVNPTPSSDSHSFPRFHLHTADMPHPAWPRGKGCARLLQTGAGILHLPAAVL